MKFVRDMKSRKPVHDNAVSPVVGVMLMLVVTIIIAAVVSGFAGGLIGGNNQKAPSLTMDVKISNTGTWIGSGFSAVVTSVSEPIATSNIRIVTSWKTTMKNNTVYNTTIPNGAVFTGGATSTPGTSNAKYKVPGGGGTGSMKTLIAPFATGPGVSVDANPTAPYREQQFGNYSLVEGTGLYALPFGTVSGKAIGGIPGTSAPDGYGNPAPNPYMYTTGGDYTIDATQAILGFSWEQLRPGDIVTVSVVHTPSGKVIFQKDVVVSEG